MRRMNSAAMFWYGLDVRDGLAVPYLFCLAHVLLRLPCPCCTESFGFAGSAHGLVQTEKVQLLICHL
jgi:hypothetical protein